MQSTRHDAHAGRGRRRSDRRGSVRALRTATSRAAWRRGDVCACARPRERAPDGSRRARRRPEHLALRSRSSASGRRVGEGASAAATVNDSGSACRSPAGQRVRFVSDARRHRGRPGRCRRSTPPASSGVRARPTSVRASLHLGREKAERCEADDPRRGERQLASGEREASRRLDLLELVRREIRADEARSQRRRARRPPDARRRAGSRSIGSESRPGAGVAAWLRGVIAFRVRSARSPCSPARAPSRPVMALRRRAPRSSRPSSATAPTDPSRSRPRSRRQSRPTRRDACRGRRAARGDADDTGRRRDSPLPTGDAR